MQLIEIPVGDVYPDENNPRKDYGDLDALAASFALNETSPGEPFNPIVVVRDGGIYRIVDGERRWRAMRKAGTCRCHAVACDGLDEANAMVAMLATDDKLGLTEIERSRGVQQMLLLGVDPERVERAGRMAKGSAAKVRRARRAVDDAGDDMTLDRMIAIAEFDEEGDDDAVARLESCREDEWRKVADGIRDERRKEKRVAATRASLEAQGVPIVDEKPDGYVYAGRVTSPDAADGVVERQGGAAIVAVRGSNSWDSDAFELYMEEDSEDDPSEFELDLAAKDIMPYIQAVDDACLAWFDGLLSEGVDALGKAAPNVSDASSEAVMDRLNGGRVVSYAESYEVAVSRELARSLAEWMHAAGYLMAKVKVDDRDVRMAIGGSDWYAERFAGWLDWCRLHIADGMEMPQAWKRVVEFAKEHGIEAEEEED